MSNWSTLGFSAVAGASATAINMFVTKKARMETKTDVKIGSLSIGPGPVWTFLGVSAGTYIELLLIGYMLGWHAEETSSWIPPIVVGAANEFLAKPVVATSGITEEVHRAGRRVTRK